MAIREIDGQTIILGSCVAGFVVGAALAVGVSFVIYTSLYARKCPPADCSQQVFELKHRISLQDSEIQRLKQYEQAVKWGKK